MGAAPSTVGRVRESITDDDVGDESGRVSKADRKAVLPTDRQSKT